MPHARDSKLSRRAVLQAGLFAGVGAALAQRGIGAETDTSLPLITKPIPTTGERLPVVGVGTDSFRSGDFDELQAVLRRMHELGGTVIDTAAAYGDSEDIIGRALSRLGVRDRMFVATKLTASGFFGVAGRASFEQSLQRLKTDRIDLLQVHNLNGVDTLMPLLREWKQAGKIRYLGITTSRASQHAEMVDLMRKHPLDFVQVDYSIANRDAAASVLPVALERKIAVLANLPLGRASLIRQAGARDLPRWAADIDVSSWSQFFLKYVVSHPAVTCAIPGSTKVPHLEDNQRAARGRLPDAAMRERMEEYWEGKGR
ncbi:MAG: aldo/keto reductase [Steroidobacterales bacterium]